MLRGTVQIIGSSCVGIPREEWGDVGAGIVLRTRVMIQSLPPAVM